MTTSSASRFNERNWARATRVLVLALSLVAFVTPPRSLAADPVNEQLTSVLEGRLARLMARDDAKHAEGAIVRAREALEMASGAGEDVAAATRGNAIAKAAIVLGERQLERREVQNDLFATQRRLTAMRERANAQRRVLEALMRERASLAREGEQP